MSNKEKTFLQQQKKQDSQINEIQEKKNSIETADIKPLDKNNNHEGQAKKAQQNNSAAQKKQDHNSNKTNYKKQECQKSYENNNQANKHDYDPPPDINSTINRTGEEGLNLKQDKYWENNQFSLQYPTYCEYFNASNLKNKEPDKNQQNCHKIQKFSSENYKTKKRKKSQENFQQQILTYPENKPPDQDQIFKNNDSLQQEFIDYSLLQSKEPDKIQQNCYKTQKFSSENQKTKKRKKFEENFQYQNPTCLEKKPPEKNQQPKENRKDEICQQSNIQVQGFNNQISDQNFPNNEFQQQDTIEVEDIYFESIQNKEPDKYYYQQQQNCQKTQILSSQDLMLRQMNKVKQSDELKLPADPLINPEEKQFDDIDNQNHINNRQLQNNNKYGEQFKSQIKPSLYEIFDSQQDTGYQDYQTSLQEDYQNTSYLTSQDLIIGQDIEDKHDRFLYLEMIQEQEEE